MDSLIFALFPCLWLVTPTGLYWSLPQVLLHGGKNVASVLTLSSLELEASVLNQEA